MTRRGRRQINGMDSSSSGTHQEGAVAVLLDIREEVVNESLVVRSHGVAGGLVVFGCVVLRVT